MPSSPAPRVQLRVFSMHGPGRIASPATLLRDYARLWEDFDPAQRVGAEDHIAP